MRILLLLLLLTLAGCRSAGALNDATMAANAARDLLAAARPEISAGCVAAYDSAKTAAELAAARRVCVPLAIGYKVALAAWAALVPLVIAVQQGGDSAAMMAAAAKLPAAIAALSAALASFEDPAAVPAVKP